MAKRLSPHAQKIINNESGWLAENEEIIDSQEFSSFDGYNRKGPMGQIWDLYVITRLPKCYTYYQFCYEHRCNSESNQSMELIYKHESPILLMFHDNQDFYLDLVFYDDDDDKLCEHYDYLGFQTDHDYRHHMVKKLEESKIKDIQSLKNLLTSDLRPVVLEHATIDVLY
jgi:hypothetical protein